MTTKENTRYRTNVEIDIGYAGSQQDRREEN